MTANDSELRELQDRWTCFNDRCDKDNRCVPCRLNLEKIDLLLEKAIQQTLDKLLSEMPENPLKNKVLADMYDMPKSKHITLKARQTGWNHAHQEIVELINKVKGEL